MKILRGIIGKPGKMFKVFFIVVMLVSVTGINSANTMEASTFDNTLLNAGYSMNASVFGNDLNSKRLYLEHVGSSEEQKSALKLLESALVLLLLAIFLKTGGKDKILKNARLERWLNK